MFTKNTKIITNGASMDKGADYFISRISTDLKYKLDLLSFEDCKFRMKFTEKKLSQMDLYRIKNDELHYADEYLIQAAKTIKRAWPPMANGFSYGYFKFDQNEFTNNLIRLNYFLVKDSDALFIIDKINNQDRVEKNMILPRSGCAWAVQIALDLDLPVFIYDDFQTNTWHNLNLNYEFDSDIDYGTITIMGGKSMSPVGKNMLTNLLNLDV